MLKERTVLSNNIEIPSIGFGTYKLGSEEDIKNSIKKALEIGYRHIDTASFYGNEEAIGKALKESNVKREEIFLATKLALDEFMPNVKLFALVY